MSWKSVEMQVALPRTQDMGKLQEQMSKQNQRFQESLAQSQLKQEQLKRKQVNELEETIKSELKDEEDSQKNNETKGESKCSEEREDDLTHPFLGSNIDFSG